MAIHLKYNAVLKHRIPKKTSIIKKKIKINVDLNYFVN